MVGGLVGLAAERLTKRAVGAVERQLFWALVGALLAIAGFVFLLAAAYGMMEPEFGAVPSAAILALVCVVLGVIAFKAPDIMHRIELQARDETEAEYVREEIDEEAHRAVDRLGPAQVTFSAFMIGLTAGRQIRRNM